MEKRNIGIKLPEDLAIFYKKNYKTLNTGTKRIIENLPVLRSKSLHELKGKFAENEILFLFLMRKEAEFSGKTVKKYLIIEEMKEFCKTNEYMIDPEVLIEKIRELNYAHLYFLFDWIDSFYSTNTENFSDIQKYVDFIL